MLVEGVSMVKRHTRPNPQKQIKGGIAERESAIAISNVMVMTSGGVATRVGYRDRRQRRSASRRVAKKGGEILDKKYGIDYGAAQRSISENSRSGADQGVRLQEPHGGAEDRKDLAQHRHGRGHAEQQADRRRGERADGRSPDRSR